MATRRTPLYVLFIFFTCVSAEGWDDFANNLATDLAPLITLFGEQITRQCLSESISALDDFIFSLAPLGVLTAVVSAIRVCGNSTVRAFIGRAQEDPGTAERELLSCVSNSTAEIFSSSGVVRITGNPKILEVLVNENPETDENVSIQKVSEVKNWPCDLGDGIQLPNLSLNKGIRRRAPFWFYLSAAFGVGLQSGVVLFAGLTVFRWPNSFRKNGHSVDSYAFPMFVVGTFILTLGMFFCAYTVETSCKKRFIPLPDDCRVYWVQPGNQMVGDQVFPPFVGRTKKGARFVRSIKRHSPTEILNYGKEVSLLSIVMLAMVGFVMQFIGLRGLHSSVTLAQLGSTMVMTLVRTSLRAQRMHDGDNMLGDDEALVLSGGHELDWLIFSLMKIQSFRVCPIVSLERQSSEEWSQLAQECVGKRTILRTLTSSNWNETPIRRVAIKLAQATYDLMRIMNLWTDGRVSTIDINIPIQARGENASEAVRNDWKIALSISDEQNSHAKTWEAILGLYVWSIKRANHGIDGVSQGLFFKIFQIRDKNAHQTRLLLQKWSTNARIIGTHQESLHTLRNCQTFGHSKIQSGPQNRNYGVAVEVDSGLDMLAAQDIYAHVLFSALTTFPNIGGKTSVSGNHKNNFRLHNDRVDTLATAFQNAGLGDFSEGLLCILPVLYTRKLLPEISVDSLEVRQQQEIFAEERNHYALFTMSEWLCCLDDHGNVERSLIEYGFLCLCGLMNRDFEMRDVAIERIVAIGNSTHDGNSLAFGSTTHLSDIASIPSLEWWDRFRNEMHCMAKCISQYQAKYNPEERTMESLAKMERQLGALSSTNATYNNLASATEYHSTLLGLWFGSDGWVVSSDEFAYQRVLDWLIGQSYKNILEWLIMRLINCLSPRFNEGKLAEMMIYAAKKDYTEVIQMLEHHGEEEHLQYHVITSLASKGDLHTLEMFFRCWNDDDTLMEARELAFLCAAENKCLEILDINIQKGVNIDVSDPNQETALMKAAEQGDVDSIILLLSRGAALEKRNNNQDTALIAAAEAGNLRAVELLVEAGADINATGGRGRTALMGATRGRIIPIMKYLLSQNADVHIQDSSKETALDAAIRAAIYKGWDGPWKEACTLLENAGAVPNISMGTI